MSAPLNLSVVVPLYNEEESLPHLVEQLLSALRPTDEAFELVLVDDGSSVAGGPGNVVVVPNPGAVSVNGGSSVTVNTSSVSPSSPSVPLGAAIENSWSSFRLVRVPM